MLLLLLVPVAFIGLTVVASSEMLSTFGSTVDPVIMSGSSKSSYFENGKFHNKQKTARKHKNFFKILKKFYASPAGKREPKNPLPVQTINPAMFQQNPDDLRITWLGHSSMMIETVGYKILTDPVFSERASPFKWIGPKRFHPAPVSIDDLPEIDVIVISHDHYDHLDYQSIKELAPKTKKFVVPLGVGEHLIEWGISDKKIIERDWWQQARIDGNLSLIATPAQHFSGRGLLNRNTTLWSSWVIKNEKHRIYFSGDTGMFDEFKKIGDKYGPFDATLLHVGAYSENWPAVHMTPEEAVQAHKDLKGKFFIPIHWGTFSLAFHGWDEPAERLMKSAISEKLKYAIPLPGQTISQFITSPIITWWREIE